MDIDWSKAPEGTTHFDPLDRNHLRQGDGFAQVWNLATGWEPKNWQYPHDLSTMDRLVARPIWVGDGDPPVGTVCEFNGGAPCPYDPWHPDLRAGDHVTIIAYFNDSVGPIAVFTFKARNEDIAAIQVEQARPGAFLPIRTPEQIAAEERETAISKMKKVFDSCSDELMPTSNKYLETLFGAIHDAGWKQVQP